jgi:hypothetical protein
VSLFGPKPDRCPAPFTHCGKCNIYPCLIGAPAINPARRVVEVNPAEWLDPADWRLVGPESE